MNKQGKLKNGKIVGGIEWTKSVDRTGWKHFGYTWNPLGGCNHGCKWVMPDGSIARCYAHDVAEGVARAAYPKGFEHHYWHPERLTEPARLKTSARIFMDSMSDFMGAWVPEEHIYKTLLTVQECHWHDFQMLTKNAPRLLKFAKQLPRNLWIGVSMPPSIMNGHDLTTDQQARYMEKAMYVFRALYETWHKPNVTWLSLEPLSFDVADMIDFDSVDWIVIGAASNGKKKYQPNPEHVQNVLNKCLEHGTPVFFKGNLEWSPWMEEFPITPNFWYRDSTPGLASIGEEPSQLSMF